MKIIGIEEHFLSPDVRASWAAAASAGQDESESLHFGEMQDRLEELSEERLERMDESGIDVQVLSLTSPGLHNLAPAEGISLARRTNDLIAATIAPPPRPIRWFRHNPYHGPWRGSERVGAVCSRSRTERWNALWSSHGEKSRSSRLLADF